MKDMLLVIVFTILMTFLVNDLAHANQRPTLGAMIQIGETGMLKISTQTSRALDRELGPQAREKFITDMVKLKEVSYISKKYKLNKGKKYSNSILALYAKLKKRA